MSADNTNQKWTVMIYMAGDNNLSADLLLQIKDIQMNQNNQVRVVIQYDPNAEHIPTQRFVLTPSPADSIWDSLKEEVEEDDIEDSESGIKRKRLNFQTNTGTVETLKRFIKWAWKYKSENNMLVLSGHSSGIELGFLMKDENPFDSLSLPELEAAIYFAKRELGFGDDFKPFKIIGFDSCMMSMVEIAHELRNHADYMIGTQGPESNAGWCFGKLLNILYAQPNISASEFACEIVGKYILHYFDYISTGVSVDIAVCNLNHCERMKELVNELATKLSGKIEDAQFRDTVLLAHWEAQTYGHDRNVDLYDFCDRLQARCSQDKEIFEACKNLKDLIRDNPNDDERFVLRSGYSGATFQYSHGTSIHFPWAKLSPLYLGKVRFDKNNNEVRLLQLDFLRHESTDTLSGKIVYSETEWRKFVESFVDLTRRPVRDDGVILENRMQQIGRPIQEMGISRVLDREDGKTSREDGKTSKGLDCKCESTKNPPKIWKISKCLMEEIDRLYKQKENVSESQ